MSTTLPSPFKSLGGDLPIRALVERFYEAMERTEPALARLHALDEQGRVARASRDRFALFLIGWMGGPQDYITQHGHPRLRMRHSHLPIDIDMRDAWLRCMNIAMDETGIDAGLRSYLEPRFAEVADFLRNR